MGPELMSYGSLTGESYLSDLTLAFLEDTGFYQPEYDEAGRLLPPAANDVAAGEVEPSEAGTSVQTASEAMTKVRPVLPCWDWHGCLHGSCCVVHGYRALYSGMCVLRESCANLPCVCCCLPTANMYLPPLFVSSPPFNRHR